MNLKHAGVYQITCIPSGNVYIGSSVALDRRLREHKRELRIGTHCSSYMQNSWNKYGHDAFEFKVLVICEKDMTLFYEQILLDALEPKFNTAKIAGSNAGIARSDETKKRMSKAQRNSRKKYEWKGQKPQRFSGGRIHLKPEEALNSNLQPNISSLGACGIRTFEQKLS